VTLPDRPAAGAGHSHALVRNAHHGLVSGITSLDHLDGVMAIGMGTRGVAG
jgi:hypothetical protein